MCSPHSPHVHLKIAARENSRVILCDWASALLVHVTSGVQLRFEFFRTREITCYLITRRSAKENAIGANLL